MSRTIPSPRATRPQAAPTSPLALTLALAGIGGWDARVGRLDRECQDLVDLVAPPSSRRAEVAL